MSIYTDELSDFITYNQGMPSNYDAMQQAYNNYLKSRGKTWITREPNPAKQQASQASNILNNGIPVTAGGQTTDPVAGAFDALNIPQSYNLSSPPPPQESYTEDVVHTFQPSNDFRKMWNAWGSTQRVKPNTSVTANSPRNQAYINFLRGSIY